MYDSFPSFAIRLVVSKPAVIVPPVVEIIGFAIGAACGIIVPELHKRAHPAVELSLKDTPFGNQLALKWNIGTKKKSVLKEIPEAPPVL